MGNDVFIGKARQMAEAKQNEIEIINRIASRAAAIAKRECILADQLDLGARIAKTIENILMVK